MKLVINFFGGPGCGKSTMASRLFSELKSKGVKCEYVTEYAKDVTYAEDWKKLSDQLYITSKQNRKMNTVYDKVDVIITDSPLLLGRQYAPVGYLNGHFDKLVLELFNQYNNVNILLTRTKEYAEYGRSQTYSEAKDIDVTIKKMLQQLKLEYLVADGDFDSIPGLVKLVIEKLGD